MDETEVGLSSAKKVPFSLPESVIALLLGLQTHLTFFGDLICRKKIGNQLQHVVSFCKAYYK